MNSQSPQMLILQSDGESQEGEMRLKSYWAVFKRRCHWIFLIFVLITGVTGIYLIRTPRGYEATAVVNIPRFSSGGGLAAAIGNFLPIGSPDDVATEIEKIKGRNIAEKVINKLELDKKDENLGLQKAKLILVFQKNLRIKQRGRTDLIDITAIGSSSAEAQGIANQVAIEYIQLAEASKNKVWGDLINQMEDKLEQTKSELEESRRLLHEYEAKEGISTAFGSLLIGGGEGSGTPYMLQETTQAVGNLKASIMEMEIQLETLRRSLSEGDPKVITLKDRIAESKLKLQKEQEEAIEKYNKQFGLTKHAAEVVFNQQMYSMLVSKQEELKAQYVMQNRSPEVIERAEEPIAPSSPRRKRILIFGMALGILLGIGVALLREFTDSSIHAVGDVHNTIGSPVLGKIPRLRKSRRGFAGKIRHKKNIERSALINYSDLTGNDYNRQIYKESYIMLQLELMAAVDGRSSDNTGIRTQDGLTLLVTSSVQKEGKSLVAANLAITIAQTGKKVLLVDANCRNPAQHILLDIDLQMGLTDFLTGKAGIDDIVGTSDMENLYVVLSGVLDDKSDVSSLFISPRLGDFIGSSRQKFDVIIIDSPSAISASDPAVIGSKTDGVLLVVKVNDTKEKYILQTKQKIQNSGGSVLGVVLNSCN